jgi:hypothetical protein
MHSPSAMIAAGLLNHNPWSGLMFPVNCSSRAAMHVSINGCATIGVHSTGTGISMHTVEPGWYVMHSLHFLSRKLFTCLIRIRPLVGLINAMTPFLESSHSTTRIYLEPWHPDIVTALQSSECGLTYAVWVPDLL